MVEDHIWNLIAKKLSGEGNDEELKNLEKLIRENPELRYPVQQITDTWFSADAHADHQEAHDAFIRHVQRMKDLNIDFNFHPDEEGTSYKPMMNNKRRFLWPALAASLFIGGLVFGYRFSGSADKPSLKISKDAKQGIRQIITSKNSKTKLTLSDGTTVLLNAGSRLTYDSNYNKNIREVSLTGEGFFDVFKNKNKPFIIHTSKINIKVLGTVFNVRSYAIDKTTEASLIRGSIEVTFQDNPNKKIILKPNEKVVVDNDQNMGIPKENSLLTSNKKINKIPGVTVKGLTHEYETGAVIETSWVENKLIFQDESFEQISHQLERWYGVSIIFKNQQLKENHLTGNFTNESMRQALDALKLTASFHYEIDQNNNVTIY